MDMFGSDDSDDEANTLDVNDAIVNELFTEIVKTKLGLKTQNGLLQKHVLILAEAKGATAHADQIFARLNATKLCIPRILDIVSDTKHIPRGDVLVFLGDTCCLGVHLGKLMQSVTPGGYIIMQKETYECSPQAQNASWQSVQESTHVVTLRTRHAVPRNPRSAIYWANDAASIAKETQWLNAITLPLSIEEQEQGVFSEATEKAAMQNLTQHGVCIFRGLFDREEVLHWGAAAKADMCMVLNRLRGRGIDLLEPREGQWIENFHEMGMREALRCDLRNGKHMKAAARKCMHGKAPNCSLRNHPGITGLMLKVMNPDGGEDAKGNWGRWNFEGGGPQSGPPPMVHSQVRSY